MSGDLIGIIIGLVATLVLIAGTALFVFHEFSVVTISPTEVRRLASEKGSAAGRLVAKSVHNLDHYIAVDQVGITITTIGVGWIGQPVVADILEQVIEGTGALGTGISAIVAGAFAFALLTSVQMIAGELMPKTVALRHPGRTASFVAVPVEIVARLVHPLVWLLNGAGTLAVRALGITPAAEGHAHVLPAEELALVIERSARAGTLRADPAVLRRALRFSELVARDIMVPRSAIAALDIDATYDEVMAVARRTRFTRYPVYRRSLDDIVGVLNIKDLVQRQPDGEVRTTRNWQRVVRPVPVTPESAPIERVLVQLRQARQHIVLVVDQFGGVAGIVTVADVVGEIVGEPDDVQQVGPNRYLLQGQTPIATAESVFNRSFGPDEREYDTVAGLILESLGRFPTVGERVRIDGAVLVVVRMKGHRIDLVALEIDPDEAD